MTNFLVGCSLESGFVVLGVGSHCNLTVNPSNMKITRLLSCLCFIEDLIMQELVRSFMLEFRVRIHSLSLEEKGKG